MMSDDPALSASTLGLLFVQALLVGALLVVVLVGASQGALWWGSGEAAVLFHVAGWAFTLMDLFVVLVVAQLGLGGSYILRWAWTRGPLDVAAELVRTRRRLARVEDERDEARAKARQWEQRYRKARRQHEDALGNVPDDLLRYYADGPEDGREAEELRRRARREIQAWEAMGGTFHTDAVAPLLDAIRAVPEDHAAGTHHHTSRQVLDRLIRISQELKDDDWFTKAIRWMAKKYGPTARR